ncbi:MAG: ester cyclase [Bacteroidota bacterium]|nr:ester cyclase [Bacteroidota bacterium]
MKPIFYLLLISIVILFSSCRISPRQSSERLKSVADAYVYAWNTGNLDTLDAICDSAVVRYDGIAPGYEYRGLQAFKRFIFNYRTMFPDFKLVVEKEFFVDNQAILRWVVSGTNTGPGFLPPTGKSFRLSGISILQFNDGKLTEDQSESDGLYFMEQLGYTLVPPAN